MRILPALGGMSRHERYVLDILLPDGTRSSLWFAYHPWATAAVLEGICGDMWKE
jgi:hypothetical protein